MTRKIFFNASLAFLLALGWSASAWAVTATDKAVETALQQELGKKYKDVRVTVDDRVATLNGAVDSYLDKLSVAKTAKKYSALYKVVNGVTVAGPTVPDQQLYEHLAKELSGDRTFNGNVFDAFYLLVQDGAVTISGYAHNYLSHDSALGIVESEKGVKNVVDKMEVLPLSRFDDGIRLAAARTIYGRPGMEMYAINPAHPIRIIVNNGNVILDGEVLNKMDKELAEMGALQVPGVFSVTNNLRVGNDSRNSRTAD